MVPTWALRNHGILLFLLLPTLIFLFAIFPPLLLCYHDDLADKGLKRGGVQLSEELLRREPAGPQGDYYKELLQRVLGRVTKTLESPKAGSREVTAAISGCRYLIQPTAAFLGPQVGTPEPCFHLPPVFCASALEPSPPSRTP